MSAKARKIIGILKEINPFEQIDESTKLVESGIIDSLALMILISLLEENFGIEVPGEEYIPENFESVEAIERLVEMYAK